MKTCTFFTSMLFALLLFANGTIYADTIHSAPAGGNWHDLATWQEGVVPGAGDDVIITGPGEVIVYNTGHECNNLTIDAGALLRNRNSISRELVIHGNLINYGTLTNAGSSYRLTIRVGGDLENYGTWEPYYTILTGTGNRNLTCGSSQSFNSFYFDAEETSGNLTALTDILFYDSRVNVNGKTIILSNTKGSGLSIIRDQGSLVYLENAVITGNNNSVYLENGAYLNNVEITDAVMEGKVMVRGNSKFYGEIINNDTLMNTSVISSTLPIYGNFTNNGIVTQSNYNFSVYCYGDVVNNGIWDNNYLCFAGSGIQYVSCPDDHYFSCYSIADTSVTGYSPLNALTDLRFYGSSIDLNWGELLGNDHEIFISGGGKIQKAILNNIQIGGTFRVYNNIQFTGNTVVKDSLLPAVNSTINLYFDGNLTNNGIIMKYNYNTYLYITGNVVNNGEWITSVVNFTGSSKQYVTLATGKIFNAGVFFNTDNTYAIEALSNLSFVDTELDMNGGEMIFPDSKGLTLSVSNGWLQNGTFIMNNGTIFMENGAGIKTSVTVSDVNITGNMRIGTGGVTFEGEVVIQDTVLIQNNSNINFSINGNIVNNGVLKNTNAYSVTSFITGNIINNGEWINIHTRLSGAGQHEITLGSGKEFTGRSFQATAGTGITSALTGLHFRDCEVDFNDETLVLSGDLALSGGSLQNAMITGNDHALFMENNAYMVYCTISDITINGNVKINQENSFTGELLVGDTLSRGPYNAHINLDIEGNITNNGHIINNSNYNLNMYLYGNIINNGEWIDIRTRLSGTGAHDVSLAPGKEFSGELFHATAGTGITNAITGLHFRDCEVDFNDETLVLSGDLALSGGSLQNAMITGNDHALFMEDNAYMVYCTISDITINGNVKINQGNSFTGELLVGDTLSRGPYNAHISLDVEGNITNNGHIINNSNYNLDMYMYGNIINNGYWDCSSLFITGTNEQHINCMNGNIFHAKYCNITNKLIVGNDLSFLGTQVSLTDTLVMPENGRLSLPGETGNTANLSGGGAIAGGSFEFETNEYFSYITQITIVPDVTSTGDFTVGSGVDFLGSLDVRGTMQQRPGQHVSINVAGRIVNNGLITNNGSYRLTVYCQGHIINNGTWANYLTELNGVDDQLIYLIAGKEMAAPIQFRSDITGSNLQWEWNYTPLDSPDFSGETTVLLEWNVPVSTDYIGGFRCHSPADSSRNIVLKTGIIIDPVVQLQGPFNGNGMDTHLAQLGLVPLEQPFNKPPWNYNGDEEVPSIPSNIVDWVLAELRETAGGPETATGNTVVMQRALLLRNDGRIVDPYNQTPELKYDIELNDNIYLVVHHRNHIAVMSGTPVSGNVSPAVYDFSLLADQAYGGTLAHKQIAPGIWGMTAADGNADNQVNNADKNDVWAPQAGTVGYLQGDFNLDGQVNNSDKIDMWAPNTGLGGQVPE